MLYICTYSRQGMGWGGWGGHTRCNLGSVGGGWIACLILAWSNPHTPRRYITHKHTVYTREYMFYSSHWQNIVRTYRTLWHSATNPYLSHAFVALCHNRIFTHARTYVRIYTDTYTYKHISGVYFKRCCNSSIKFSVNKNLTFRNRSLRLGNR